MQPLRVEQGSHRLELGCGTIDLGRGILELAWSKNASTYLVLLEAESPESKETVLGISENGKELFRCRIPEGWKFYYFSSHIDYPLAIICTSESERFDWYWGIDATRGSLVSLNRAY